MTENKNIKKESLENENIFDESKSKNQEDNIEESEIKGNKPSSKKAKSKKPIKKSDSKKKKLEEEIEELEEKNSELNNKFIRLYSEFDNFRKRSLKEKDDLRKTASKEVILSLLPVIDDFERAMNSFDEAAKNNTTFDGIKLIYNKLMTVLKNRGMEQIIAVGNNFDTDFHEAIAQIPAPKKSMKDKVVDEIEKGYLLEGKVIRYSKVIIGK
ncbi:MAG: nucleotide exchange factor GrpE [Bacteroidales bacterium]|nr:nucleotide exchange factor GrpE [Bacteroidales bacterium]